MQIRLARTSPNVTTTRVWAAVALLACLGGVTPALAAQQEPAPVTPAGSAQTADGDTNDSPQAIAPEDAKGARRMFGVLPNYTTVEHSAEAPQLTSRGAFRMAALNSFDPFVFPFVAFVAGLNQVEGADQPWPTNASGYARRYAVSLADNSIGNFMTTGVMPTIFGQDPRYFQLGSGSAWRRTGYALSRTIVTRSRSGHRQFNVSEIGGNAIGAGVSNLYYPAPARSVSDTLTRWGMQIMWDSVANELKEFWPDIQRKIHHG